MRIVIVGDGKVGSTLADELSKEDHDVVMIDRNPEVLDELVDRTDVSAVVGIGATLLSQRDAGVGESDLLIAATSADDAPAFSSAARKERSCDETISRQSCSTQPGFGKYWGNSRCETLHISPLSLKRMQRLEVVPASRAMMYFAMNTSSLSFLQIKMNHSMVVSSNCQYTGNLCRCH